MSILKCANFEGELQGYYFFMTVTINVDKLPMRRGCTSKNTKKRHSQECLSLAAESAAPTASANDD